MSYSLTIAEKAGYKKSTTTLTIAAKSITRATLPQYLLSSSGTLYEGFETLGDWTAFNASLAADTTNVKTGGASLQVTSTSGGNGAGRKTVNWDLSGVDGTFRCWCYISSDPSTTIQNIIFQFHTNWANDYYQRVLTVANEQMSAGWNYLVIRKDDCTVGNGSPDWSNIVYFAPRAQAKSGQVAIASFDDFRLVQNTPAVLFNFDDARSTTFTTAYPILKAHNIRGSVSVITSRVGTSTYMTWDQLRVLANSGWTIYNHTKDHTDLDTLTEAQQETEMSDAITAMTAQELDAYARYLSYPSSAWNTDTLTAMAAQSMEFGLASSIDNPFEYMPKTNMYLVNEQELTVSVSLATAKGWIDTCLSDGIIAVLNCDYITNANYISVSDFQALVDYIVANKASMYAITVDDFVKLQSGTASIPVITA